MKPRYVVIDEYERDNFEKEYQMPFGYGNCVVFMDPQAAINTLEHICNIREAEGVGYTTLIVEKISDEGRELYYRI